MKKEELERRCEAMREKAASKLDGRRFDDKLRFDQHTIWEWNQEGYREREPRSPYGCATTAFMEWMPVWGPTVGPDIDFWAYPQTKQFHE